MLGDPNVAYRHPAGRFLRGGALHNQARRALLHCLGRKPRHRAEPGEPHPARGRQFRIRRNAEVDVPVRRNPALRADLDNRACHLLMERSTWTRWAPPTISQAIRAYRRAISAPTGYDYAVDVLGDAT